MYNCELTLCHEGKIELYFRREATLSVHRTVLYGCRQLGWLSQHAAGCKFLFVPAQKLNVP